MRFFKGTKETSNPLSYCGSSKKIRKVNPGGLGRYQKLPGNQVHKKRD